MKATEALKIMVASCDKSAIRISREIGRKDNYVSSLINSGSVPSIETFASIASACGAELRLVLPERTVLLDGWEMLTREEVIIREP